MNLFSGLNNLKDITLDERYSTVCGYTHNNVTECFGDYLKDADLDEMKRWYNGYSFIGESVYNPYDILLFFDRSRQFRSYWFETGTPTFLMDKIREKKYYLPDLENIEVSEEILNTFDVGNIPIESLMFQTGYLTIKQIKPSRIPNIQRYCLGFPNFEVRHAFLNYFIDYIAESYSERPVNQDELYGVLEDQELNKLETVIRNLFSGIPYNAYTKNCIADYEGFYLSVIYAYFYSLGMDIRLENVSSRGRADMVVRFPENTVYIFEFKVVEEDIKNSKKPLEQIKQKGYFEKYKGIFKEIFLIGIEFSRNDRNILSFEWEKFVN